MAKIAYGNKENIQDAIDGNVIPYDALVLTSDGNDAEMFFYDKDGNLKNIVNKTKFTSLDEAQEWILKYPCVGQNFTIYNGTGWGSYIVTSENILNPIATNTDIKNLTETKADKATTYTATETDDMLSTKADKADLDWKLIGESNEITEADVVSAGDKGITSITIDLGKPIDSWYRETRIDIYSPKSTLNSANSGISINMGVTEEYSHVFADADLALGNVSFLVGAQSPNFAPLFYNYNTRMSVITAWDSTGKALYSTIIITGANAYAYPYTTYGTALFYENHKAIGKQFVTLLTRKNDFKFPAGAKITMYGRGKV